MWSGCARPPARPTGRGRRRSAPAGLLACELIDRAIASVVVFAPDGPVTLCDSGVILAETREPTMDTTTAWELFIAGFTDTAYARRVARRCRAGPLEAVRFAGDEDRPDAPFDEYFVRACAPEAASAAVAVAAPLAEHYLTVLADRPALEQAYARGGYRLSHSETLMACDLAALPAPALPPEVTLVRSAEEAAWHNASDPQGLAWVISDNLADPRMAHYAIVRDGQPVARGRNLWLDAQHSYVSRVYVAEAQRGQGLARALMMRLLADDRARGARWSVLTASGMGERLYAGLGYRPLGTILIFEPARG